ncbi:MAG: lytic transglycosylase domain-containing protein [Treponema sp.]|nr:lytic transglycosylase domain-containing protein [Treponema sp.]
MIDNKNGNSRFFLSCLLSMFFTALIFGSSFYVYRSFPVPEEEIPAEVPVEEEDEILFYEDDQIPEFASYLKEVSLVKDASSDRGLYLYRQQTSKAAVEWFYAHVTGNREVSDSILAEAEKNDIPLSLAFSLAYTESRYRANAVNSNSNSSIDRGLFQLNSNSFPNLTEEDFFNPAISAKYGMSHLKFCLDTAGNEVSALAMYNAGTGKVRSNRTPQSTLNYVGKIMSYQDTLDRLFEEQVASYYELQLSPSFSVAYKK